MTESRPETSPATAQLAGLGTVVAGPLGEIAHRLSTYLQPFHSHDALVIFTRECTGRPRKVAGDPALTARISIFELQSVRDDLIARSTPVHVGALPMAGVDRPGLAVLDADTGILLVLATKTRRDAEIRHICAVFAVVATSIRHQVSYAGPSYLAESRAASAERSRTIVQMADQHSEVLTKLLALLRSTQLDDRRARAEALTLAGKALIDLRAVESLNRDLAEESAADAFSKMRSELEPYLRHKLVKVEYIAPNAGATLIPGEVARGIAALVRSAVMGLVDQDVTVKRMRIAWDCDSSQLSVDIRDDAGSQVVAQSIRREASERARALDAELTLDCTPGWGTRLSVVVPLNVVSRVDRTPLAVLNARELDVLSYVARGWRNRAIGQVLQITESTVKFHVTQILRKLGASNRAEAGAMAVRCGLVDSPVDP